MDNLKLKNSMYLKKLAKRLNIKVPKVISSNCNTIKLKSLVFQSTKKNLELEIGRQNRI